MTSRTYDIVDRYGNRVDDDDILPDGGRLRVPLMMRDGMSPVQRAVADDKAARRGFDDSAARHQPGPIYCDRSAARAAYEDARRELSEAWRTPTADVADRRRRRKATTYDPQGRATGSAEWEEEEDDAATIPFRGQQEGDQCTIDGAPGHLNAKLECVADRHDDRPVPDAAAARRIKREAYDAMVADMCEAWRKPLP